MNKSDIDTVMRLVDDLLSTPPRCEYLTKAEARLLATHDLEKTVEARDCASMVRTMDLELMRLRPEVEKLREALVASADEAVALRKERDEAHEAWARVIDERRGVRPRATTDVELRAVMTAVFLASRTASRAIMEALGVELLEYSNAEVMESTMERVDSIIQAVSEKKT